MFANKIKLTDAYLDLIVQKRKEHAFTAYQLSEYIGKNKSWLPNIENHRTKNITKEDFLLIFHDFAKEENMDTETYIIKYLPSDAIVELEDHTFVPCYHLKEKFNLLSPDTKINEIPLLPETSHTKFDKQSDKWTQLIESLSNFNEIIQHTFFAMSDQEKQHTLDMLLTMRQNLSHHFTITRSLYEIPIFEEPNCQNQPLNLYDLEKNFDKDSSSTYSEEAIHILEDLSHLIKNFSDSISFLNAKAKIYRFFDTNFSTNTLFYKINHYQYGNLQELTEILFDIETYVHAIYDYVTLFYKHPKTNSCEFYLDYQELYHILLEFINDFLRIAELTYAFDFKLPNAHPTKEELEKKHLEITNILFQIRKLFYNKYNQNYIPNAEDSLNQSETYFEHVSYDKAKEQKNLKQKAKEQKYLKSQKIQKMQKLQKETTPIYKPNHEPESEHNPIYKSKPNKTIFKTKNKHS